MKSPDHSDRLEERKHPQEGFDGGLSHCSSEVETSSSGRKMQPHGILEMLAHGLLQTPPRIRLVRIAREQYGNNLGRKPSQMIPNDPKSVLL